MKVNAVLHQVEGCRDTVSEGVQLLGGRLDALVNNAGQLSFLASYISLHCRCYFISFYEKQDAGEKLDLQDPIDSPCAVLEVPRPTLSGLATHAQCWLFFD